MNVSRNTDLARSLSASVRGRLQMMNDPIEQKRHIMNIVNDAIRVGVLQHTIGYKEV
jgi:hypothetical protein